jgi:hypothetical protein
MSSGQQIIRETSELNNTIGQVNSTGIYRVLHPAAQYGFFSVAHRTFSKINHILEHKISLSRYNIDEIFPCIILDHIRIKL